jgi:hypothetical protein
MLGLTVCSGPCSAIKYQGRRSAASRRGWDLPFPMTLRFVPMDDRKGAICVVCDRPATHNHSCTCGSGPPDSTCPLHGCIDWDRWYGDA